MSERPISVGDLVQVVRGHICDLGTTFIVQEIRARPGHWTCSDCKANVFSDKAFAYSGLPLNHGAEVWWLKRIPPLEELEGQRTQETLRLPKKEAA